MNNIPLLVFIGPSGVGKSTIVRELVKRGCLALTPTWTDRPQRKGEEEIEHTFVSAEKFDRLVVAKFFAHKPLTFFGLPYRYATPPLAKPGTGKVAGLMARVSALSLTHRLYPGAVVYQIEAPRQLVETRLRAREQAGAPLGSRLADYEAETIAGREQADRVFVNDGDLDAIVAQIEQAVRTDFGL